MNTKRNKRPIGFEVYRGPSAIGGGDVVGILTLTSRNRKTGDMAQLWILPADRSPLDALRDGENHASCGDCPLQGVYDPAAGRMSGRVCYVNVGQAPVGVWKAFRAGRYDTYRRDLHAEILADRSIRLGAYGDPAALPDSIVEHFATVGRGWTGYSHQLFRIDRERADRLARWLMVSCHNQAQLSEARRRGWRAFVTVAPEHAERGKVPAGAVECPAYTRGVSCETCQLCRGTSRPALDVYAIGHGRPAANLLPLQPRRIRECRTHYARR